MNRRFMREDIRTTQFAYRKVRSLIGVRGVEMKSPGESSLWTHKTGYTFKNRTAGVGEDAEQPKLVGVRTGPAS